MTRPDVPLGRIIGIPISLDYSWFLIFALLTWMLAASYYPAEFKNWSPLLYWFMGAATAILLFASVLLHELGHSVVALRFKVPVRSITLFIFGGVARIGAEPPSAKAEFFIAVAGPIVSLALAVLFSVIQPALAAIEPLWGLAKYLAYINFALVLFNLIPGFPLDGGRVFRALVWAVTKNMRRATLVAANAGRRCFLVSRGADTVGLMTLHRIKEVLRPEWANTTAAQVMLPLEELKRISPATELRAALELMDRGGVNQLPVMTDRQVVGMLSREDVITFLRTVQELGT